MLQISDSTTDTTEIQLTSRRSTREPVWKDLLLVARTTSGPYDISTSFRRNSLLPTRLYPLVGCQILEAPENDTIGLEGERVELRLVLNKEFEINPFGTKEMVRTDFSRGNRNYIDNREVLDGDDIHLEFSVEEYGAVLTLTIDYFDPKRHSGYICFGAESSFRYLNVQACTVLKGVRQVFTPILNVAPCSGDLFYSLPSKTVVNLGQEDCIQCVATGLHNAKVVMLKENVSGRIGSMDTSPIFINSPWIVKAVHRFDPVTRQDDGRYTCIALDEDDNEVIRKTVEVRAMPPLEFEVEVDHTQNKVSICTDVLIYFSFFFPSSFLPSFLSFFHMFTLF